MYITLETDYAIRIVYFLAERDEKTDAKTIAERTGVTFRFALKILRKLVSSQLVKSFKGTKGGYQLNQPPEQITLKDLVQVIEGEIKLSRCITGEFPCTKEHKKPCKVQQAFKHISTVLEQQLQQVTIASLIDK